MESILSVTARHCARNDLQLRDTGSVPCSGPESVVEVSLRVDTNLMPLVSFRGDFLMQAMKWRVSEDLFRTRKLLQGIGVNRFKALETPGATIRRLAYVPYVVSSLEPSL